MVAVNISWWRGDLRRTVGRSEVGGIPRVPRDANQSSTCIQSLFVPKIIDTMSFLFHLSPLMNYPPEAHRGGEVMQAVPEKMTLFENPEMDGLPYKRTENTPSFNLFRLIIIASAGAFIMFNFLLLFLSGFANVDGFAVERQASSASISSTSSVAQYTGVFQTTPEFYAGMLALVEPSSTITDMYQDQRQRGWLLSWPSRILRLLPQRAIFQMLLWRPKFLL